MKLELLANDEAVAQRGARIIAADASAGRVRQDHALVLADGAAAETDE